MENQKLTGREKKRNQRTQIVIKASYKLFLEKKIESASIQEIADEAEIGVASVYRYFTNKGEMAVEAAILSWESGLNPLLEKILSEESSGIAALMNGYLDIFKENPDFFRYLEDFDNYISKLETPPLAMERYEKMLIRQDEMINSILQKDVNNGTLRTDIDIMAYLNMAGQAVIAMAQKLVNRGNVVSHDEDYDPSELLKMLVETLYNNIIKE
ncbi:MULTISPECIES: TetR/AcrR family transcriptional regulator [unclassified Oceanispirochaeta]|uniref:TetR/AcrR family transcriptional regulator n=1 Tax=unclassified Oceanispirochaeta TaxID=2635722 RepID=UPI000E096C95|nr:MULTISPECIES: TetR/AcrR family transcriptional regulator [unclassified Oceanispirochaeta]MBF9014797.1 TetR/AcrR family transcriptional regulator [Oceanispirochaeta sp. M2]NPD71053.1 TetR/AcrR family transcriptional regulator [Oceanispirochaeta sp. M1]RDG33886.1 TetR/AcrR family transcriptional regulator [Oceanispirochaeta sp. M1]